MKSKKQILLSRLLQSLYWPCVVGISSCCAEIKSSPRNFERSCTPRYGEIHVSDIRHRDGSSGNRLEIKPAINGRVEKILVAEGQTVTIRPDPRLDELHRAGRPDRCGPRPGRAVASNTGNQHIIADSRSLRLSPAPSLTVPSSRASPSHSATPILVLSDRLIVRADVDETDIGRVMEGQIGHHQS